MNFGREMFFLNGSFSHYTLPSQVLNKIPKVGTENKRAFHLNATIFMKVERPKTKKRERPQLSTRYLSSFHPLNPKITTFFKQLFYLYLHYEIF